MGDSTVGQQSEEQKFSSSDEEDLSNDGSFLSPEETDTILSSLEAIDQKVLGAGTALTQDDEGFFISPEEIEGQTPESGAEGSMPQIQTQPEVLAEAQAQAKAKPQPRTRQNEAERVREQPPQSDLLSRIAGELRSIKSEIGTLKNTYDDMITRASSMAASEYRRETVQPEIPGQVVPDEILVDLKKLLGYLDRLLESLPEDKIDGFARSEYFELYRKIFEFFDLV